MAIGFLDALCEKRLSASGSEVLLKKTLQCFLTLDSSSGKLGNIALVVDP